MEGCCLRCFSEKNVVINCHVEFNIFQIINIHIFIINSHFIKQIFSVKYRQITMSGMTSS